jgi:hypothetical protein
MKTIEFGGVPRPVKYGINALAEFSQGTGTSLDWIFRIAQNPLSMNFNEIRWLVYVGLKQGAIESGQKVDFDIDQVGNWLDKEFGKFPKFSREMNESMPDMEDDEKNPDGSLKQESH